MHKVYNIGTHNKPVHNPIVLNRPPYKRYTAVMDSRGEIDRKYRSRACGIRIVSD